MKRCDLHTHSCFSDGTLSPSGIVELACEQGIAAVALTDHNTTAGLASFMEAGCDRDVATVPGCEFTSQYNGRELHIVGLFFPRDTWEAIEERVETVHEAKRRSNRELIDALRRHGYDVTYEESAALTPTGQFNRAHVAQILFAKGQIKSIKEGFRTILSERDGYYVPPEKPDAIATVRFIKDHGAVAVLAHPLLNLRQEEIPAFLEEAKPAGLDAMETRYSEFDDVATWQLETLAGQYGLLCSGGSDFHGSVKPDIALGTGRGDLAVPFEFYEELQKRAGS